MANPTRIPHHPTPDQPGNPAPPRPRGGEDPLSLNAFRRHVEALGWRLDGLRPDPDADPNSAEVFEALESTLEELRVAVEELRTANDALRGSRAEVEAERRRYRDLFDQAPDPYLVTDLQGVIREANRAAVAALNVAPRFLVGKPMAVFLPEEGRPAFRSELARARDSAGADGAAEYEMRLKPRELPPFDAAVRVGLIRDDLGRPAALRWTVRDVSAQRRAEAEVRALNAQLGRRVVERSEQLEDSLQANERLLIRAHAAAEAQPGGGLFQELVEEVDAILWRADAETGRYTFVSRHAEELLGYLASTWLEDPDAWLARVHPEDRDWAGSHRRKQLREGVDFEAEYRMVAAGGRTLWFRESIRVVRPGPGRPAVLCGLMVNITRRKKVERQLHAAKGELASELRDMAYLRELGGRLAIARGWRETLDEINSAFASLLGAEMAMVLIREPGGGRLALAAGLGLPEEFARALGRGPVDPGPIGRPLAARQAVVVEDAEAAPVDFLVRYAARIGGFRAALGVPLFTRDGEFLGALAALFRAPHRPPARQARLAEMYAEQAAEAIEAARLLDLAEEAGRRRGRALEDAAAVMKAPLAAILDAARALARDPDEAPGTALGLIEHQAGRLLDLVDGLAENSFPPPPLQNQSTYSQDRR